MAGIDKTYITRAQWLTAKTFWDQTKDQQTKELGYPIGLYCETYEETYEDCVLWNTSTIQDYWLFKNCPLNFIQNRLIFQYQERPAIVDLLTFETQGVYIRQIESRDKKIGLYFWKTIDSETTEVLDETDEVLLYGTTYLFEVLNDAKKSLVWNEDKHNLSIRFDYYGADLTWEGGEIKQSTAEGIEEITIGRMFIPDYEFKFPKIKYSLNSKDIAKYKSKPEYVFFSTKDEVYSLADFPPEQIAKMNLPKALVAGRFGIPHYIMDILK